MRITMIGHSTVLIETDGKRLLTDPYFGLRGNPAYSRIGKPAQSRQELRTVDGVLVSHDHWDHVDWPYFRLLEGTPVITPHLTRWFFKWAGCRKVCGLKPWEDFQLGGITITAVPAVHITATVGFVVQSEGRQVYFAGDTLYHPFMEEIGRKFRLDVALMPVTTYRIPMTMGESQALQAVAVLHPACVIPIHLGLLPRSFLLRTDQTPERFAQRLASTGAPTSVVILEPGASYLL